MNPKETIVAVVITQLQLETSLTNVILLKKNLVMVILVPSGWHLMKQNLIVIYTNWLLSKFQKVIIHFTVQFVKRQEYSVMSDVQILLLVYWMNLTSTVHMENIIVWCLKCCGRTYIRCYATDALLWSLSKWSHIKYFVELNISIDVKLFIPI